MTYTITIRQQPVQARLQVLDPPGTMYRRAILHIKSQPYYLEVREFRRFGIIPVRHYVHCQQLYRSISTLVKAIAG